MLNSGKAKKYKLVILFIIVLIFMNGFLLFNHLHDYLCYKKRVDCNTLVIEGWLFDYMLDHAAREIKHNHYNRILILCLNEGMPVENFHKDFNETEAYRISKRLTDQGIDPKLIRTISGRNLGSHHTFTRALTLKKWIEVQPMSIKAFNVYTGGPHARKTYTAFTRVFGYSYKIGVISSPIEH